MDLTARWGRERSRRGQCLQCVLWEEPVLTWSISTVREVRLEGLYRGWRVSLRLPPRDQDKVVAGYAASIPPRPLASTPQLASRPRLRCLRGDFVQLHQAESAVPQDDRPQ